MLVDIALYFQENELNNNQIIITKTSRSPNIANYCYLPTKFKNILWCFLHRSCLNVAS